VGKQIKKALVCLSGGQDSTTCLYQALRDYDEVAAIGFNYSQNNLVELEYARRTCDINAVPFEVIELTDIFKTIGNTTLIGGGDVNAVSITTGLPAAFVPNRNQIFITIAHGVAQKIGAQTLITGICELDVGAYPDCTANYLEHLNKTTNIGSGVEVEIKSPFIFMNQGDIFKVAEELGVLDEIIEHTITCYNGDEDLYEWGRGCGDCPACEVRIAGFEDYEERHLGKNVRFKL
jgi:7-cyano-7-deazaguanine synthase